MGKAREVEVLKGELEDQKKVMKHPPEARCVQPEMGPEKSQWRGLWEAVSSTPDGDQGWM